jgi:beta-mannosidase
MLMCRTSRYLLDVPVAGATPDSAAVAMTHLTPHTHYLGAYPTAPLLDGTHGGFRVNVTAHFWAPAGGARGSLTVRGEWDGGGSANASGEIELPTGQSQASLQITATAAQIKLWWPSGLGAQRLYNVSATWRPSSSTVAPTTAVRRLGFRVFALVTINDTNASIVAANASTEGTGKHGMFFRVSRLSACQSTESASVD